MNKKGFVLMETIAVITVLTLVLTLLYASFNVIVSKAQKNSVYDNTEYIYKTQLIRDSLEYTDVVNSITGQVTVIDKNDERLSDEQSALFAWLGAEKVYITLWDPTQISRERLKELEATTQQYIKYLDPYEDASYRIIVMFDDANNNKDGAYQYASLKWMG